MPQNKRNKQTLEPLTKKMEAVRARLRAKVKARIPFIWIVSDEETRINELLVKRVALPLNREIIFWSCSRGLVEYTGTVIDNKVRSMDAALDFICKYRTKDPFLGTVFILQDPQIHLSPATARVIRDMYIPLQAGQHDNNKRTGKKTTTVFLTSGRVGYIANGFSDGLEPSISNLIDIINIPLPTKAELTTKVSSTLKAIKSSAEVKSSYTPEQISSFAGALQGLTTFEALRSISECFHMHGQIEVNELQEKKRQIVKQDGLLEVVENLPDMNQVGGLDEVKKFINMYSGQFSEAAKEFGLEPLRGLLLVGIQGCGKSLISKAIASLWKIPCIRLDIGRVMSGVVGSSEANIRRVIKVVEAAAPCLLWCDEIEKQMSGTASSNFSDSGTTSRVFGTLLTAMEEGMKDVCILATANDITALPPELIRRFDELFFADLPVEQERKDILEIHLRKRKRDPEKFDLASLVQNTYGFTGSEIEKVVKVGLARAFHANVELREEDILSAITETRPLSKTMSEQIKITRKWAAGRARRASSLLLDEEKIVKVENTVPSLEEITAQSMQKDEVN